ncbi:MAG: hypothetical protein RLZZ77_1437 [Bacteroidota bacterium]
MQTLVNGIPNYLCSMEEMLDSFEKKGFCLFHQLLPKEDLAMIRQELEAIKNSEQWKKAGIGKMDELKVDSSQRGDFIHWIDPHSLAPATSRYFEKMDEIIQLLNRSFYLGIRDSECHYTEYPVGTFYKRHVDRHRHQSSRIVSMVFYLNENWTEADGGQLMVYHEDGSEDCILPQEGLLAVFLSEKEHEVLPTHRVRQSITGWMLNEVRLV